MTPEQLKEAFPNGTKVLIASALLPNYKKVFGKLGEVVGSTGLFLMVDYEHLKDIMYIHYSDLRKAQ